jgi:4-coumarate--CoA ligase
VILIELYADTLQELIKVNGLQVAPAELEAVLLEHPHVADAAVVGILLHDEEWPRAYVVLKESSKGTIDQSHIHAFMKERVAKHKQLVGGIAYVEEIPKLASGKITRKEIREWAKRDVSFMETKVKARL